MNHYTSIKNSHGELLDTSFHAAEKIDSLVIIGHGVTGNKDRPLLTAVAAGLAALGWPCLRISFSGNGESDGEFTESTITKEIADLQAVIDAVPAGTKIAYCGHSMGGAVGVLTTVRDERISCLITLAGMVQTADFCQREFSEIVPDQGCMWDENSCPLSQKFLDDLAIHHSTLPAAEAMEVPWLLIHGTADDIIPVAESEAAYAAAPQPKKLTLITAEGHSFSEATYPQVITEIAAWLRLHKI